MQNKIYEGSKQPSRYKQKGKGEMFERGGEEKDSELVFILDRSASMSGLKKDTIKGFNDMLKKQKKQTGRANVTTVLFDDASEVLYFRKKIEDVPRMTDKEYFIGGCTALLDAVGRTIHKIMISEKKEKITRRTNSVVFVIITDGFDNASTEYTYESVKKLIERQKRLGWEFLFLGANMDAVAEAANIGISSERSVTFHNDSQGVALNYEVVGETVSAMRMTEPGMSPIDSSWKTKIEKDYKKER